MKTLFGMEPDLSGLPDCELTLHQEWIEEDEATELFKTLRTGVAWQLKQVFMYGRWVNQPRLTALHGDQGLRYSYTGSDWDTHPWLEAMIPVKERIEQQFGQKINSVLCNLYRNGNDYCGWHTDFGKTDGPNPQIFSLSLGAERPFQIRHNTDPKHQLVTIRLGHGSLLYMGGEMQKHWKHQVPKAAGAAERINLTFRCVTGRS